MLPVHSKPERMALQILDLTIGVKQFWPQPETFEWSDGRRPRRYTPDCGVVTSNRRIMIEAKLEEDAEAVHNVEVRELSAPYLKAEGWELLLLTEKVLFHPDLLKNVRELRRRRNHPFSEAALRAIHHHLEREESMSFSDCAAVATSMGGDADMLYTAIGRRQLYCNLWEPLTPASPLIHAARAPRPFISELLGEN